MPKTRTPAIAPVATDYVLPARPRLAAEVVVVPPSKDPQSVYRRGGEVARALGAHFALLAETQQLFLAEVRERLEALDGAIADATKAQLKGALREVLGVLEWCDTTQTDLVDDAQLAAAGCEPIDVTALAAEVAQRERSAESEVLVTGNLPVRWWGESATLANLIATALTLVGERTEGKGTRVVEIAELEGKPSLRIASNGEPQDTVEPATAVRFRGLANRLGAAVLPDALGPGGAGVVILLGAPAS